MELSTQWRNFWAHNKLMMWGPMCSKSINIINHSYCNPSYRKIVNIIDNYEMFFLCMSTSMLLCYVLSVDLIIWHVSYPEPYGLLGFTKRNVRMYVCMKSVVFMVIFVLTHTFTMKLANQWQINLATGWTLPNTCHKSHWTVLMDLTQQSMCPGLSAKWTPSQGLRQSNNFTRTTRGNRWKNWTGTAHKKSKLCELKNISHHIPWLCNRYSDF